MMKNPEIESHPNVGGLRVYPPLPGIGETQANKKMILNAMAEDDACRYPGVTIGIHYLSSLKPFARLGHGLPMIRKLKISDAFEWVSPTFQRAETDQEFVSRFREEAPYLASFDFKKWGICLAGGAVNLMLMHTNEAREQHNALVINDFDLFLVGHKSEVEVRRAIDALRYHLCAQWGVYDDLVHANGRLMHVYRTQGCITFHSRAAGWKHRVVQVILRRYSTEAEVIHGFDLGLECHLWNGEHIVMTTLGKIAVEHGANVLNLKARRNSYERRIARYFDRGFDLILPDLDGCSLLSLGGRLPYLYAVGLKGGHCACSLTAESLTATRPGFDNSGRPLRAGEAGMVYRRRDFRIPRRSPELHLDTSLRKRTAIASPRRRALGGDVVRTAGLCASAPLTRALDIFAIEPTLDVDMMTNMVQWAFLRHDIKRISEPSRNFWAPPLRRIS